MKERCRRRGKEDWRQKAALLIQLLQGVCRHWNPAVLTPPSPHQNPAHKRVFLA